MGTPVIGLFIALLLASGQALPSQRSRATLPVNFVGEGTNELATAILQGYVDNECNLAFSPLGYSLLLTILAEGARGSTREQLTTALHLPDNIDEARNAYKNILLRLQKQHSLNEPEFRNWFYVYKNFSVEQNYKDVLLDNYYIKVLNVERIDDGDDEKSSGLQTLMSETGIIPHKQVNKEPQHEEIKQEMVEQVQLQQDVDKLIQEEKVKEDMIEEISTVQPIKNEMNVDKIVQEELKQEMVEQEQIKEEQLKEQAELELEMMIQEQFKEDLENEKPMKEELVKQQALKDQFVKDEVLKDQINAESILQAALMEDALRSDAVKEGVTIEQAIKDTVKEETLKTEEMVEDKPISEEMFEKEVDGSKDQKLTAESMMEQLPIEESKLEIEAPIQEVNSEGKPMEFEQKPMVEELEPMAQDENPMVAVQELVPEENVPVTEPTMVENGKSKEEEEIMIAMERSKRFYDFAKISRGILQGLDVTSGISGNNIVSKGRDNDNTLMVVFNGLYFRGTWATPFGPQREGLPEVFYKSDSEKIPVPVMHTQGNFRIGSIPELDSVALELPYEGGRYSLLVLLPNSRTGLRQLVSDLAGFSLRDLPKHMSNQEVQVCLPSFDVETITKPIQALNKFGVNDVFSRESADLSGISKDSGLYVQELVQLVTIKVDIAGSRVNPFSAMEIAATRTGQYEKFVADHPFLFFVRDVMDDLVVVAGKVVDPSIKPKKYA